MRWRYLIRSQATHARRPRGRRIGSIVLKPNVVLEQHTVVQLMGNSHAVAMSTSCYLKLRVSVVVRFRVHATPHTALFDTHQSCFKTFVPSGNVINLHSICIYYVLNLL